MVLAFFLKKDYPKTETNFWKEWSLKRINQEAIVYIMICTLIIFIIPENLAYHIERLQIITIGLIILFVGSSIKLAIDKRDADLRK